MKKLVELRMTIKDGDNTTLMQVNTYGAKLDERTIFTEGRYFKAGRKAGFGKSAYIYEHTNGQFHKVIIDHITEVA